MRHLLAALLAIGLALVVRGVEPNIQCTGVLVAGAETKVALARPGAGPAQWIAVGGEFNGYTVSSYESASDTVILTKDGEKFRVKLQDAKVVAGAIEPPPEVKKGILNNLRQLAAAADQYYLENGRSTATLSDLAGSDKYIKHLQPVAGEDYSQLKFEQGKPISVTTADGYTISYRP